MFCLDGDGHWWVFKREREACAFVPLCLCHVCLLAMTIITAFLALGVDIDAEEAPINLPNLPVERSTLACTLD